MESNTQDIDSLVRAYRKKNEQENIRRERYIHERIKSAREEVKYLVERFQEVDPALKRIILFGSLAENRVVREHFDIDLAFEGTKYIQCLCIAMQSTFKVDLVDLQTVRPGMLKEIEQSGKVVFHAKQ